MINKGTFISVSKASHLLIPDLESKSVLSPSQQEAAFEALELAIPSLASKSRKQFERANRKAKKEKTKLPKLSLTDDPPLATKLQIETLVEDLGYTPTDGLLIFVKDNIEKWLPTKAAASDTFRIWVRKYRAIDNSRTPESVSSSIGQEIKSEIPSTAGNDEQV